MLGMSAPSVRTAVTTAQKPPLDGAGKVLTAVDEHGILSSSEGLYQCFALNGRGARMEVTRIDPRITEGSSQCNDVGDVHAEH